MGLLLLCPEEGSLVVPSAVRNFVRTRNVLCSPVSAIATGQFGIVTHAQDVASPAERSGSNFPVESNFLCCVSGGNSQVNKNTGRLVFKMCLLPVCFRLTCPVHILISGACVTRICSPCDHVIIKTVFLTVTICKATIHPLLLRYSSI